MTNTTKHYGNTEQVSLAKLRKNQWIRLDNGDIVQVTHIDRTPREGHVQYVYFAKANGNGGYIKGSVPISEFANVQVVQEIYVGMPATICLMNDTSAAVVTKINAKSIVVRRVATTEAKRDEHRDGTLPVMVAEGILDQPVGDPQRFAVLPNGRIGDGSIRIRVGRSIDVTDYRY